MQESVNINSSFKQNLSEVDSAAHLEKLLRQQSQQPSPYENNLAILGCGYVGKALAKYWQKQGHFVTGTTTSQQRLLSLSEVTSQVILMKGDDANAVQSLFQDRDAVVVSVAPTGSKAVSEEIYESTYLPTAWNLAKALNQTPTVKQIIYLSSSSVYGDRQGEWVDESSPIAPEERKSQVICEAEKILLQAANENQKVCILRLGGIYGPGRELTRMFGRLAGMTLAGRGERFINWIHLDDIVGAIEFARLNKLEGIYNLVDDSQLTLKKQAELVCLRYGLTPVQWDPSKPSLKAKSVRISNQKIKAAGYQLVHPQLFLVPTN